MLDNAGTPSWRALSLLVDVGLRKPKKEKRMTRNPKIETFGGCLEIVCWLASRRARYLENPVLCSLPLLSRSRHVPRFRAVFLHACLVRRSMPPAGGRVAGGWAMGFVADSRFLRPVEETGVSPPVARSPQVLLEWGPNQVRTHLVEYYYAISSLVVKCMQTVHRVPTRPERTKHHLGSITRNRQQLVTYVAQRIPAPFSSCSYTK